MKDYFQNFKNNITNEIANEIDFFLRQNLRFSRKNYFEKNESKENLFVQENLIQHEKKLYDKFNLSYLKSNSTRQNYLENLYIIDLLDKYLDIGFRENLRVLDIGCKNWFYAKGEYSFFKKYCRNLILDGIELDTNRLYTNFYSRKEVAKFHIKDLSECKYIEGDFLETNEYYDYIVWVLPFIFEYPHLRWGLPKKYFQPEKMLLHAYNSLKEDGMIFITNQGEEEYEAQKALCEKLHIPYLPLGEVKNDFFDYKFPRYSIFIKNKTQR